MLRWVRTDRAMDSALQRIELTHCAFGFLRAQRLDCAMDCAAHTAAPLDPLAELHLRVGYCAVQPLHGRHL